jgi:hypothetical protein
MRAGSSSVEPVLVPVSLFNLGGQLRKLRNMPKTKGSHGFGRKVKALVAICIPALEPSVLKLWNLHDRIISLLNMPQEIRYVKSFVSNGYQHWRDHMPHQGDPNTIPFGHPESFEIASPHIAAIEPVIEPTLPGWGPEFGSMALRAVQMNVHAYVTYPTQVYQQQRPFNPALLAGLA